MNKYHVSGKERTNVTLESMRQTGTQQFGTGFPWQHVTLSVMWPVSAPVVPHTLSPIIQLKPVLSRCLD